MTRDDLTVVGEALAALARTSPDVPGLGRLAADAFDVVEAFDGGRFRTDPRYAWGEPEHRAMIAERVAKLRRALDAVRAAAAPIPPSDAAGEMAALIGEALGRLCAADGRSFDARADRAGFGGVEMADAVRTSAERIAGALWDGWSADDPPTVGALYVAADAAAWSIHRRLDAVDVESARAIAGRAEREDPRDGTPARPAPGPFGPGREPVRCARCGSPDVDVSVPAWCPMNGDGPCEPDSEADPLAHHCNACGGEDVAEPDASGEHPIRVGR